VGSGRTLCLWLNTGRIREVYDTGPFRWVRHGYFPAFWNYNAAPNGELVERAFFCTSSGRIYLYDWDRKKPYLTLMDPASISVVTAPVTSKGSPTQATVALGGDADPRMLDCRLYIVSGQTASAMGTSAQITGTAATNVRTFATPLTFQVGDIMGLSPVYTRVVFGPLMGLAPDGTPNASLAEFFRPKKAVSMQAAFADVTRKPGSTPAFYRALAYSGNGPSPISRAFVRDATGARLNNSITDESLASSAAFGTIWGDVTAGRPVTGAMSQSLAMGWECWCPGVDYTLLSLKVVGDIHSTDRQTRSA
jgi:hypothetical protein